MAEPVQNPGKSTIEPIVRYDTLSEETEHGDTSLKIDVSRVIFRGEGNSSLVVALMVC